MINLGSILVLNGNMQIYTKRFIESETTDVDDDDDHDDEPPIFSTIQYLSKRTINNCLHFIFFTVTKSW